MRKLIQCVYKSSFATSKEIICAIKKAGFDGVFLQLYNDNATIDDDIKLCKDLGLEISFLHLDFHNINDIWVDGKSGDAIVDKYLKDIDKCKNLGVDKVVMHVTNKFVAPTPSLIGLDRLRRIISYAKMRNINVCFENMKIAGYLEYIFDNLRYDNIGVCFDTGHYHCFFKDKFDFELFEDKIMLLHIHDNYGDVDSHNIVFDGNIDWEKLIKDIRNANYQGDVILENCYSERYTSFSLDEFYYLTKIKACKLLEIFNE